MFLEVCVALAVLLLGVLLYLQVQMRASQEAGKTDAARSHVQALESLAAQMKGAVDGFHERTAQLTTGLTTGQGQASQSLRDGLDQARTALVAQIESLTRSLNQNLAASNQTMDVRLADTGKVVGDLRAQIAALQTAAEGMQTLGKEVSELQNVLRAPKLRGNLGEVLLGELLDQILGPGGYEMQHRFSDRTVVDAAIKLRGQWVSVDAKFPLESFNRMQVAHDDATRAAERRTFVASVKARVDEIASKYIRPAEGTFDFALMYLPAEGIYYEVVVRDEAFGAEKSLLNYALEKKVIPVGPNTLFAYLSTIVMGLKGMRIEERAREIQGQVGLLQQRFGKFFEVFDGIGKNLKVAQDKFSDAQKRAGKLNDLMGTISGTRLELPEEGAAPPADVRVPLPAPEHDAPA